MNKSTKFSDYSVPPSDQIACPSSSLPLNNIKYLTLMKDVNVCTEPGYVVYLEFDISDPLINEFKMLRTMDNRFTSSTFNFHINVRNYQRND